MEEERVVLKQQKVQLNLLCAWNLIDKYQDPFGDCHFPQLKVDIRPLGAFQRTRDTDSVFLHQEYAEFHVPPYTFHGERCCHAVPTQSVTVQTHNTHPRHSPCVPVSPPCKPFSPAWGTKPAAERSSKSALLRRRKRYFNSAVNKFCPFTCVRNTLNKLGFQDLAPRQWPNKRGLTAPGERRGTKGKHILHKTKSLPEPWGQTGLASSFDEHDFYITCNLFSDTFSAFASSTESHFHIWSLWGWGWDGFAFLITDTAKVKTMGEPWGAADIRWSCAPPGTNFTWRVKSAVPAFSRTSSQQKRLQDTGWGLYLILNMHTCVPRWLLWRKFTCGEWEEDAVCYITMGQEKQLSHRPVLLHQRNHFSILLSKTP